MLQAYSFSKKSKTTSSLCSNGSDQGGYGIGL
jgi:hypothetical protein